MGGSPLPMMSGYDEVASGGPGAQGLAWLELKQVPRGFEVVVGVRVPRLVGPECTCVRAGQGMGQN